MVSDESFRDAYKPLQIPSHYDFNSPELDRVLFALAHITEGTVNDVSVEMAALEPGTKAEDFWEIVNNELNSLYLKGLLKGTDIGGEMHYNLSKITEANDGAVDPELLAPGLD